MWYTPEAHGAVGGSLCGNSGPTCCAYSKREIRYGAGGRRPEYMVLLIESKASINRPHSIIVPTLLKSVSGAWRNKRTMISKSRVQRRRKYGTQRDGWQGRKKKSEGRRVIEGRTEWASKVPGGQFWLSLIGKKHTDSEGIEWKYMRTTNSNLTDIHLGKVWTGQCRVLLIGLPIKTLRSADSGG